MGKQAVAVGHHKVEQTVVADFMSQAGNGVKQNFRFGFGGKAAAQAVENKAECAFGIGRADRVVKLALLGEKINQMAVVCKQPIFAPYFAHKRVGVNQ
ncbi:hypothetical protein NEIFLAOT_02354 [Neisseria flavescens NRL30031/H210]|uniref:Uncharacterized protein n=1 Tax=Neisseria flavescens NRL30031/H210 TaxID=546264 RepID=C0EQV6_NEIFL|nr:hypothetical protein NEIFLAOT_02354 [Neisseria flavescens NRL30031/H210]